MAVRTYFINNTVTGSLGLKEPFFRRLIYCFTLFIFLIGWYSFITGVIPDGLSGLKTFLLKNKFDFYNWILIIFPGIFCIKEIIRQFILISIREKFYFNKKTKHIFKNNTKIAEFDDVDKIQIRTYTDFNKREHHRLSLILKNNNKIMINESRSFRRLHRLSEKIANVLDVSIFLKKFVAF